MPTSEAELLFDSILEQSKRPPPNAFSSTITIEEEDRQDIQEVVQELEQREEYYFNRDIDHLGRKLLDRDNTDFMMQSSMQQSSINSCPHIPRFASILESFDYVMPQPEQVFRPRDVEAERAELIKMMKLEYCSDANTQASTDDQSQSPGRDTPTTDNDFPETPSQPSGIQAGDMQTHDLNTPQTMETPSAAAEPYPAEPEATEPYSAEPEANETEMAEREAAEPEANEMAEPGAAELEAAEFDTAAAVLPATPVVNTVQPPEGNHGMEHLMAETEDQEFLTKAGSAARNPAVDTIVPDGETTPTLVDDSHIATPSASESTTEFEPSTGSKTVEGLEVTAGVEASIRPEDVRPNDDVPEASVDGIEAGPDDFQPGPDDLETGPDDLEAGPDDLEAGPDDLEAGPDDLEADLEAGPDSDDPPGGLLSQDRIQETASRGNPMEEGEEEEVPRVVVPPLRQDFDEAESEETYPSILSPIMKPPMSTPANQSPQLSPLNQNSNMPVPTGMPPTMPTTSLNQSTALPSTSTTVLPTPVLLLPDALETRGRMVPSVNVSQAGLGVELDESVKTARVTPTGERYKSLRRAETCPGRLEPYTAEEGAWSTGTRYARSSSESRRWNPLLEEDRTSEWRRDRLRTASIRKHVPVDSAEARFQQHLQEVQARMKRLRQKRVQDEGEQLSKLILDREALRDAGPRTSPARGNSRLISQDETKPPTPVRVISPTRVSAEQKGVVESKHSVERPPADHRVDMKDASTPSNGVPIPTPSPTKQSGGVVGSKRKPKTVLVASTTETPEITDFRNVLKKTGRLDKVLQSTSPNRPVVAAGDKRVELIRHQIVKPSDVRALFEKKARENEDGDAKEWWLKQVHKYKH